MSIERLKNYLQRCPAEGERVHMEFLIETWNALPKLLAAVEAGKRMRNTVRIDDESWELDEQELIDECENFDKAVSELES